MRNSENFEQELNQLLQVESQPNRNRIDHFQNITNCGFQHQKLGIHLKN